MGGTDWLNTQISEWLYEERGRPLQGDPGYRIRTHEKKIKDERYLALQSHDGVAAFGGREVAGRVLDWVAGWMRRLP